MRCHAYRTPRKNRMSKSRPTATAAAGIHFGGDAMGSSGGGSGRQLFRARQVVFTKQRFLREAEVTRNAAHKTMAEDTPGQLSPIFVFQSQEEAVADACGLAQFVQGNFTEFPLALKVLTEFSPGHRRRPVLTKED